MGHNPRWLVSSKEEIWRHKDNKDVCAQKKGHVRTQKEDNHLQVKERNLRRKQPC